MRRLLRNFLRRRYGQRRADRRAVAVRADRRRRARLRLCAPRDAWTPSCRTPPTRPRSRRRASSTGRRAPARAPRRLPETLLTNQTLFANDGQAVRSRSQRAACDATGNVRFYQSYDEANDTFSAAATGDADAQCRRGAGRCRAQRDLCADPDRRRILAPATSPREAVAGLGSAICKVPPVMMCNPAEPAGNTDVNYDFDAVQGDGSPTGHRRWPGCARAISASSGPMRHGAQRSRKGAWLRQPAVRMHRTRTASRPSPAT